jgi:uncharacterized membrane protein YbhN (UPF0104 family)
MPPDTHAPEPGGKPAQDGHGDGHPEKPRRAESVWRRVLRQVPTVLGIGLLCGAIYVVWGEFRHLKIEQVAAALHGFSLRALAFAGLWTFLAYFVLTFYDRLGTIYAGNKVSYARAAFASFCAYALSHNLGFAAVSGAAVRYRLYSHWGLLPLQIAKVVAFCSLTFGLGGMVLGGVILWVEPGTVPFFGPIAPAWVMHIVGTLLWCVVGAYITLSSVLGTFKFFGHGIELPHWRMALMQVALATVDVAVTASIFFSLLPADAKVTWLQFVGVYLASYSAGLVANLPGGLGVFDGAMLLGLERWIDAPHVLGAIVVFRLYYYIIPLFLAGSLFAGNEILLRSGALVRRVRGRPAEVPVARRSEADFAVAAATGAVALCGALLLALSVLVPRPDFAWIDPDLADMAAEAGQFVPSLIGAGLLVLAVGLGRRVNLAWIATIVLLGIATVFTVAQGERLWVPCVLALATIFVAPFRAAFYRRARLFSGPLSAQSLAPLIALVGCVMALAAFERHVRYYADNAWWELVLSPDVPNGLRLTVALTVIVALVAILRLVRPGRVSWLPWNADSRLRLARFGGGAPAAADGVVLGETERSAIVFRRCGRILLGLGDPVGEADDVVSAVWRLRDLAQQEGRDPAVWRAGPELLKVYGDLGLTAIPLGADGMPAAEAARPERYLVCVAERDLKLLLPLLPALAADAQVLPRAAE